MRAKTLAPCALTFGLVLAVAGGALAETPNAGTAPAASFPDWAYPWAPDVKPPPDDGVPRHVPDSTLSFTVAQERDLFFAPDWHPADHPAMPEIVAHGRKPEVRACGSCHRAEGTGGPENASLAGLPAAYIAQQMADFKSGSRKFAGPARSPETLMIAIAKAAGEAEVESAAAYFSALAPKAIIKVVETDTVPKVEIARVFYRIAAGGGTEPLGRRIVEVPVDAEQFEHRDSRATFIAYAPIGSIARGEALAKAAPSGASGACVACHGPDLRGVGLVPGVAGRSPSYIVRQLYDLQQGARAGSASEPMKSVVAELSPDDMIALAAYLASLTP
ncbi:MAG TPA: c-type cytochrome [Stellaceae bacterium]|nr:c-type cytochrome [Stellaceae bacterium]